MNVDELNKERLKETSLEMSIIFSAALDKITEQEKELIALKELLKQKRDCVNSPDNK